ncbi:MULTISPECIES: hypothetical protein [Sphingobacterium]|jgi:hypothetical protein|uniref:Uncharacterized protein n=1 Tax=Sphingobacterium multivorum TaxID=28454 RepID=A0A654DJY1_SPHMU|nr:MULTISPECIES: hypothetical protein [Sphingobacterium]MDF2850280.1 hypothetical protein [Sphingobacterium multivorum]SUJ28713.1 Uncharacterised protein [Sphingobacterium multivorum]VXD05637.1 conserved hypothetical protein [Sphingobacterium multivorum]
MNIQQNIIMLTVAAICSCNNPSVPLQKRDVKQSEHPIDGEVVISRQQIDTVPASHTTNEVKTTTSIKFNEFVVSIQGMAIFDPERMDRLQRDTVEIEAEVGESIEGTYISILSDQVRDLKVEQRYETSVTIMNEGPHCDLTEWKHFNSDWKPLKQNGNGLFLSEEYTDQDHRTFPSVSMDELKQKVKEQCGEEWFKLLAKVKSPSEYPSAVGISRYFLRIACRLKDNGKKVTKLIIIKTPMGC